MIDERRKRLLQQVFDSGIGALLSGVAAAIVSKVAIGHAWKVSVPLGFVVVLLVISAVFGARAGVLGTVTAALIFAAFLFSPAGRLQVASSATRANLAWMLLLGISFAFLFAPSHSSFRRR